jgi:hypothetical protein
LSDVSRFLGFQQSRDSQLKRELSEYPGCIVTEKEIHDADVTTYDSRGKPTKRTLITARGLFLITFKSKNEEGKKRANELLVKLELYRKEEIEKYRLEFSEKTINICKENQYIRNEFAEKEAERAEMMEDMEDNYNERVDEMDNSFFNDSRDEIEYKDNLIAKLKKSSKCCVFELNIDTEIPVPLSNYIDFAVNRREMMRVLENNKITKHFCFDGHSICDFDQTYIVDEINDPERVESVMFEQPTNPKVTKFRMRVVSKVRPKNSNFVNIGAACADDMKPPYDLILEKTKTSTWYLY